MKKIEILLICMVMMIMHACITAQFAPSDITRVYPARKAPDQIKVYRTQIPDLKYIEIGSVNACCSHDTFDLVEMLKLKAAESGGDAIIGLEAYHEGMSATVIRFQKKH